MPAVDPQGNQKFWFDGETFRGIQKATSPPAAGDQKFWFDGAVYGVLYGPAAGGGGGGPTFIFSTLSLAP